jgi:hypothetical protein
MQTTRHSCQVVMKLKFPRQNFIKILQYQISWKSPQWGERGSRVSQFCERDWQWLPLSERAPDPARQYPRYYMPAMWTTCKFLRHYFEYNRNFIKKRTTHFPPVVLEFPTEQPAFPEINFRNITPRKTKSNTTLRRIFINHCRMVLMNRILSWGTFDYNLRVCIQ